MVKNILSAVSILVFLSSCSSFKSLNFTSNRQVSSVAEPGSKKVRFIDDIAITPQVASDKTEVRSESRSVQAVSRTQQKKAEAPVEKKEMDEISRILESRNETSLEAVSSLQLKYAILMDTEVETLPNKFLLENVDDWYGVRYRSGGNTKSGVDCSGFTLAIYSAVYGIALPRISRDQYRISRKISTTELQEGDLVFFNTNGSGVSHVGIYLGNNKFIHASVSKGVMVSDLFESYYLKRFYGAGRIDDKQIVSHNTGSQSGTN